jgi:hypothetical protein
MSTEIPTNVTWTKKLEHYFATTGERAHCLSWAHGRAELLYARRRTLIDLPVIVLSSLTGFFSVGSAYYTDQKNVSPIVLGLISLFVSVLNTTGAYFAWSKKTEAHRVASIHYAKLYRFISVEMALPRDERSAASDFLKYCKEQYDRLAETSPALPDVVVREFKTKFAEKELREITVPEQMNALEPITVYNETDLKDDYVLDLSLKKIEAAYTTLTSPMRAPADFMDTTIAVDTLTRTKTSADIVTHTSLVTPEILPQV